MLRLPYYWDIQGPREQYNNALDYEKFVVWMIDLVTNKNSTGAWKLYWEERVIDVATLVEQVNIVFLANRLSAYNSKREVKANLFW